MIKNIVFDMGEVLLHFRGREVTERCGAPAEDLDKIYRAVFEAPLWALLDWGMVTEEEVIEGAMKELPERLRPFVERLVTHWCDEIIPVEGTAQTVKDLKDMGFGIYLLSNAGLRHAEYWKNVPGSEYFDGIYVSAFHRMAKPMPAIFEDFLKEFGLEADECLFTDDRATNLAGAAINGMHTLHFRDNATFRRELKKFGIELE